MMHRSSRESGTDRRGKSALKVGLCLANPAGGVSGGSISAGDQVAPESALHSTAVMAPWGDRA